MPSTHTRCLKNMCHSGAQYNHCQDNQQQQKICFRRPKRLPGLFRLCEAFMTWELGNITHSFTYWDNYQYGKGLYQWGVWVNPGECSSEYVWDRLAAVQRNLFHKQRREHGTCRNDYVFNDWYAKMCETHDHENTHNSMNNECSQSWHHLTEASHFHMAKLYVWYRRCISMFPAYPVTCVAVMHASQHWSSKALLRGQTNQNSGPIQWKPHWIKVICILDIILHLWKPETASR